ncbi:MAG: hypothetical protein AAGH74_06510, partial [Pseudomonadota bacterium]
LSGLVTINSTTGLSALRAGCPVKSLGKAIYDLPGLTHRGSLDSFWRAPIAPEADRVEMLVRALTAANQVPGGFDGTGVQPGAEAMAARILAPCPLRAVEHCLQTSDRVDGGGLGPGHLAPQNLGHNVEQPGVTARGPGLEAANRGGLRNL